MPTSHPRLLSELLPAGTAVTVRHPDNTTTQATYVEAIGLAAIGAVEVITSPKGRVRFLRIVEQGFDMAGFSASIRAGTGQAEPERPGSVTADTRIGVYRQPLGEDSAWSSWTWKFHLCDRNL